MRPAFSSTKSAAAFTAMLLVLLLLPIVAGQKILPPREQSYSSENWGSGPYPWLRHAIFEETNDIDIAFMGSSHMFRGIDTPYVQAKLTESLGRPAVVRTIAWGGAGYDSLYFIAKDLLAHRKVHLLVFYDEINRDDIRNVQGTAWFRWCENAEDLAGLSVAEKSRFYLTAIVGMPRNLLCLLRANLPADLVPEKKPEMEIFLNASNPATQLGSMSAAVGFQLEPNTYRFAPFVPFAPETKLAASEVLIYSPSTKTNFSFFNAPVPAWQMDFARKFSRLAQARGSQLVMLHLPTLHEVGMAVIPERFCAPEILGAKVSLVGISPAKFFANMSNVEVNQIYSDWGHFNKNGMQYFTRTITPTLLDLYAAQPKN